MTNMISCATLAASLVLFAVSGSAQIDTITESSLGYPVPVPVDALTPVDGFRSYESLTLRFDELWMEFEHIDRRQVGTSFNGRDIVAYRFSTPEDTTSEGVLKAAILIDGTLHPREWASPEVVAGIFEWLALEADNDPVARYLIENTAVVVHPLANPDGFVQTQSFHDRTVAGGSTGEGGRDGRMRRKNMRAVDDVLDTLEDHLLGTDLNRNHAVGFRAPMGTSEPTLEVYAGDAPGSEPESQALYAAADFAQVAGEDRLRYYTDFHSFGQHYRFRQDEGDAHNAVAERVYAVMRDAARSVNGRAYDRVIASGQGAGSTQTYFLRTYRCLSYTCEIRPQSFTGEIPNAFILPEAQIDETRREILEATRAAFYHVAGPPVLAEVGIYHEGDLNTEKLTAIYQEQRVYNSESGVRERLVVNDGALVVGNRYVAVLRFNKPMRLRSEEAGGAETLPGQSRIEDVALGGLVVGTDTQWVFERPGNPLGYLRYPGDTLHVTLDLSAVPVCPGEQPLSVLVGDLVGQLLDGDPRTVVDWSRDGWVGYEDHEGGEGTLGGIDALTRLVVEGPEECDSGDLAPWTATDIGELSLPGRTRREQGCYRLFGSGAPLAGLRDEIHFLYQEVSGDVVLTVNVAELAPAGPPLQVGLMLRAGIGPNAPTASVVVREDSSGMDLTFYRRSRTIISLRESVDTTDRWIRLVRQGGEVIGSHSSDGVTWNEFHRESLDLPAEVLGGIFVAASEEGPGLALATVCSVSVERPEIRFLRGDCDQDGDACSGVNDALTLLSWLFRGDTRPPCVAACDTDGNGETELTDAVYGLDYCFSGTAPPPAPFPRCGEGMENDLVLGCRTPPGTCN